MTMVNLEKQAPGSAAADQIVNLEIPAVTAPRESLARQLFGFRHLWQKLKFNLDIRQACEGVSKMWRAKTQDTPKQSIPIRWDATEGEWKVDFITGIAKSLNAKAVLHNLSQDLVEHRSRDSTTAMVANIMEIDEARAFMVDAFSDTSMEDDVVGITSTMHGDEELAATAGKRYELLKVRTPDEREVCGVKRYLPKKELRDMKKDDFSDKFGHMSCGPNCIICQLVKGNMRWIRKITDRFVDMRPGYTTGT